MKRDSQLISEDQERKILDKKLCFRETFSNVGFFFILLRKLAITYG